MSGLQNAELESRLTMAQCEITPANILAKLASDLEAQIRQAVASNPNTSIEVLSELGQEFPEEVTENPIFSMLLLENPESHFVRLSLARSTTTDEKTLAQLALVEDEEILYAVARNPKTPISILEGFVRNPPLLYNNDYANKSNCYNLFEAIASSAKTPSSLLLKLSESLPSSTSIDLGDKLAKNPNTPSEALEKLYSRIDRAVPIAVLRFPDRSSE
jgi:hypothetical protein